MRVIFDPVNYLTTESYQEQDAMIEEHFKLLGDKTDVLHLKDFTATEGAIHYAYPTKCQLNIKSVLTKMRNYTSDFPVILEEVREGALPSVRQDVERLFKLL